jgi:hypothetical protein
MPSLLLLFKLTLTPAFIAMASLAQRRWGGAMGGLIAGLPLTSGPVSVFLAVEYGSTFASHAAAATIFGTIAMSAFCVAYVHASKRLHYFASALVASTVCAMIILALSALPQSLALAAGIGYPILIGSVFLIGVPTSRQAAPKPPNWDLPARMSVAAGMVLFVTSIASVVGPKWSGLLSTLPIFGLVMGTFSHRHGGPEAAHSLLRGFAIGAIGAITYFTVVGLLLDTMPIALTYALAIGGGIMSALFSQRLFGINQGSSL